MLFGERGSGKSVFASALIDHLQARKPRTFLLHLGNSYREVTHKHNGVYAEMRFGDDQQTFRINPFVIPGTETNINFLTEFVLSLLPASKYECQGDDRDHIYQHITSLYLWDESDRRLSSLVEGLYPRLKKALKPWVGNGQFASVFDNKDDTLTFADFQTFGFQGMDLNYPQVLEPLLFYIFHRTSEVVMDPALLGVEKYLIFDEGWNFLLKKTSRDYFLSAGRLWRHYRAGIGILTQSVSDLEQSGVFPSLSELCPVKVLLASAGADSKRYGELFKWNHRTTDVFSTLIPRRQALVGTAAGWKRVELLLDQESIKDYGSSPDEVAAKRAAAAA